MADDPKQQSSRLAEARSALEDSAHREQRAQAEQTEAKRRHDALLAMEGYEHKVKRELEEKQAREKRLAQKLEEERLTKEREKQEKERVLKAQAERATALEREQQEELRLHELETAQETITKIKAHEILDIPALRTIRSDVVQSVADNKTTITELVRPGGGREVVFGWRGKTIGKNYFLIVGVSLIVLLLTLGIAFILTVPRTAYEDRPEEIVVPSLVFAEHHESVNTFDLPPETVLQKIKALKNKPVLEKYSDALYNIYLISQSPLVRDRSAGAKPLDLKSFLSASGLLMSEDLRSALVNDFMLGTYKKVPGSVFLVFKVKSFDRARAILLATDNVIISTLFAPLVDKAIGRALLENRFTDQVIKNVDSRVLTDNKNERVIIYAWPDKRTLLIASDETTFIKVLAAYLTPRPSTQ